MKLSAHVSVLYHLNMFFWHNDIKKRMCLIVCINVLIRKIEFKTEIISYIVPRGFFALRPLATFNSAGGRLESVKRLFDGHLGGLNTETCFTSHSNIPCKILCLGNLLQSIEPHQS